MAFPAKTKRAGKDTHPLRPQVKRIMDFLDASEPLEVFSTQELVERMGISEGGCKWQDSYLADYREKVDGKMFWGSPSSIKQLREQLEAHR